MANKRIFYAVQQVAIAPIGTTSYTTAHTVYGLQSVGMNTRFNLEQVFEIGQISIYQNLENIPDVEITLEKVLDGKPLIYHLATRGAPAGTLTGRSNVKSQAALSIFSDIQDSASGTPLSQVECSGMFVSSESFNFRVDGQFTEACTLVGNNKLWRTAGFTYNGVFPNNDSPTMPAGVARRQHFIWGSGNFVVGSGPYSGLVINKNKLNSVTYGGANAGGRGGNATCTYSFTTFNDFSVVHPSDPTPGLSG
jgi:hypothetical protein